MNGCYLFSLFSLFSLLWLFFFASSLVLCLFFYFLLLFHKISFSVLQIFLACNKVQEGPPVRRMCKMTIERWEEARSNEAFIHFKWREILLWTHKPRRRCSKWKTKKKRKKLKSFFPHILRVIFFYFIKCKYLIDRV